MNDTLLKTALSLHNAGNLDGAIRLYGEILRTAPKNFDALYLLGFAHLQRGEFRDAERLIGQAVEVNPRSLDAHYSRGNALQRLDRPMEALKAFDAAIAIKSDVGEVWAARGTALSALGKHSEALSSYDKAVALKPDLAMAWNFRGNALLEFKRDAEAVASYDRAIAIKPDYADAWRHRALALMGLNRNQEALKSVDLALAIRRDDPAALEDRGNLLMRLNRHEEAVGAYDGALALNPDNTDALYNRANALSIVKGFDEAIRDCTAVLAQAPDYPYARGVLVHSQLQCCDWRGLDGQRQKIAHALELGQRVVSPFNHKALSNSAAEQLQCAQTWVRNECPAAKGLLSNGERYRHDRIRLAYVSADFNSSAVATLMAGVFEHHDRDRFETIAISFGSDAQTATRSRLKNAFESFEDARALNEHEIAKLIREKEIDITVDLMGFTGECRSRIFTYRPAPIQVNFLGFPGTMGADYIDYIVADPVVIPETHKTYYAEKVVYLPHTFLPSDSSRPIAEMTPSREEAALPLRGFVFASFNNAYKFAPEMFAVWMRLLSAIEGSVLWLPNHHPSAVRNLKREAEARGVDSHRLIFAPQVPGSDAHLARLRLADLFLDTLPYNAHSTANDALWAGLPVLSCTGDTFAGRVATSLLHAVGLPELAVPSLEAYEAAALRLARDPSALTVIRERLNANRRTHPLFDTARLTRNLETAFTIMWQRQQKGEPPADFAVQDAAWSDERDPR